MTSRLNNDSLSLGYLPPQDVDTEKSILGAIMLERDAFDEACSIINADDFYVEGHGIIFKAFLAIRNNSGPIDTKTTIHQLRRTGDLEAVGGAFSISTLTTLVNSAANILTHSAIIKEHSIKRQIIQIGRTLTSKGYDDSINPFELLDEAGKLVSSVYEGKSDVINISDDTYILAAIDKVAEAKKSKKENSVIGVESGLKAVDRFTGGWHKTDLIIIAGRPGMGKTALVISMIRHMVIQNNVPIAFFSLEMSAEQIIHRLFSQVAQVGTEGFRNGDILDHEFTYLMNKMTDLMGKTILVDDTPGMSITEMKSKAKVLKKKYKIEILFVDYIQLAEASVANKGNREQAISEVSRGLKLIAKELQIPVIALSQLNRSVETRGGDKRPMLSDLRESGAIEQDADIVVFTYRPQYYGILEDEYGNSLRGTAELIFAKHRHGAIGPERCRFIEKFANWVDAEHFDSPDSTLKLEL
jgi:replicative DNA helicase